jgi:hypothetical protein
MEVELLINITTQNNTKKDNPNILFKNPFFIPTERKNTTSIKSMTTFAMLFVLVLLDTRCK